MYVAVWMGRALGARQLLPLVEESAVDASRYRFLQAILETNLENLGEVPILVCGDCLIQHGDGLVFRALEWLVPDFACFVSHVSLLCLVRIVD